MTQDTGAQEPLILYGAAEIAAYLGMPLKATQHRIDRGQIPTFRLGRTICARPSALRDWIEASERADRKNG